MAYLYQTGTANHVIHWFALLEAFLVGRGWTVVDGTGTTTVTFSSPGEGGGRTKLFIRFRQDGAALEKVWYRVQDDLAGTHGTTESATYTDALTAPGAGGIPFEYFMAADKDKVIANFKAGAGYTGSYVGIVEPFALTVDEEEQMIAMELHKHSTAYRGYVLKDNDGNWSQMLRGGEVIGDYIKDPLDNSVALFGRYVYEYSIAGYQRIVGQPTDLSGSIIALPGVNPEDIITTGYSGATSTWIVMGTGANRWAFRTGGNVPVGQLEGAYFAHTNGLATSFADFEAKLLTFMTAVGWTKVANPSPDYPIDYFWNSAGESGVDNIYLRWYYMTNTRYVMTACDDTAKTHQTMALSIPPAGGTPPYLRDGDFPTYYWVTADRDCFVVIIECQGVFCWLWGGIWQLFMPDPDSYATPYKVGVSARSYTGSSDHRMLRAHDGTWLINPVQKRDGSYNSSPNLYDGITYVVWQFPMMSPPAGDVPLGVVKYIHYIDGAGLGLMDTVAIGGRSFRWFGEDQGYGLALREA